MADWQTETIKAAQRYGLDPDIFVRQIRQESNFNPNAVSGAGAIGIAQIMPDTARGWGVDPHNPRASLDAAAKNMAAYVKQFGSYRNALVAYNAGPGRVGGPLPAETQAYIKTILHGAHPGATPRAPTQPAANGSVPTSAPVSALTAGSGQQGPSTDATSLIQLAAQQRQPVASAASIPTPAALPDAYKMLSSGHGPAPRQGIAGAVDAARTPGQAAADVATQQSPLVAAANTQTSGAPATHQGGAQAALSWARSKLGSKEATGNNDGGLAGYLNQRFGMSNQPWCAMFTSAAVTKGGAPKSARTASVYEVRRQAEQGGGGYQKGFVNPGRAKAGDLILFGNDHIGMVQSVKNGKITYVGGNQSNSVTEAVTTVGHGDIVRPLYGAR